MIDLNKLNNLPAARFAVVIVFLITILLYPSLWISDNRFPLIPIIENIPTLPLLASQIVLGIVIILLALFPFRQNKITQALLLLLLCYLFLTDINRLQPSFYMFTLLLFCYSFSKKEEDSRMLVILMFSAIYFWSGIHKYNENFFRIWLGGLNKRIPFVPYILREWFTYAVPFLEASFGLLLLFRKTRKLGGILLICMHLIIITSLILMKTGYNVIPLNILMISTVPLVIFFDKTSFKDLIKFSYKKTIIISLVWLLPVLNLFGYWDHFLSFSILSGKPKYATVRINDKTLLDKLPEEIKPHITEFHSKYFIYISNWAYDCKGIMIYPETRVYTKLNEYLSSYSSDTKEATTLIEY
jgi:methylamine utilization protein MauE